MKPTFILMLALLVSGFGRSDASVTPEQDPLTINLNTIVLKLENSLASEF